LWITLIRALPVDYRSVPAVMLAMTDIVNGDDDRAPTSAVETARTDQPADPGVAAMITDLGNGFANTVTPCPAPHRR
jgi:hypothetical protein